MRLRNLVELQHPTVNPTPTFLLLTSLCTIHSSQYLRQCCCGCTSQGMRHRRVADLSSASASNGNSTSCISSDDPAMHNPFIPVHERPWACGCSQLPHSVVHLFRIFWRRCTSQCMRHRRPDDITNCHTVSSTSSASSGVVHPSA